MKTVFVDGQEGTTGLQIRERLETHGGVRVLEIEADRRKDTERRRELINEADVVFLCLPDAAARESVALVDAANTRTRVIDSSTAHRDAIGLHAAACDELIVPGERDRLAAVVERPLGGHLGLDADQLDRLCTNTIRTLAMSKPTTIAAPTPSA